MANSKVPNVVNEDANWRGSVKAEARATNRFKEEWGWLCRPDTPPHMRLPHATGNTKYYGGGGVYTVKQLRIPLIGKDLDRANQQEATMRSFASAGSLKTPRTALDTTLYNHSRRLESINSTNQMYERSSSAYGSRRTLEQFGVSDYGHKHVL